ncbi:DUF1841 family protein [Methylobacillus gramineus]|uniref:DUF1841 family protein n=1 Tax=Methylobacillus gramineus TaxID=755169 RepID=UPI001CFFE37E|nr:DUF1841 family protein [Methylobacillus gramineus]MCB5184808.1 DUF1841 family protein [Methylobacillus gramineus]
MSLFNPSRDQVRQFFFDAWAKFQQHAVLTELEKLAVEVMQMHPEYHYVLNAPDTYKEQAYFPEMGETNPFLHMSLHLSILEQVAIDQPPGIKAAYHALWHKYDDAYQAQHDLMDCLAETIWQAQRHGGSPDAEAYIACMQAKASA